MNINPAALAAFSKGDVDNFVTAITPGGIEAQEAAGQATFCANSTLPKDCPRSDLERMGVKFGEDHDDIFVKVELPSGWKKQDTEYPMHSDLLDDKGRKRASIFYKAAFYDRRADMYLCPRFRINLYEDGRDTDHSRGVITDGETVIHELGEYPNSYKEREAVRKLGVAWLVERYPNWEDATAYWD